jgi:hypothetical protein
VVAATVTAREKGISSRERQRALLRALAGACDWYYSRLLLSFLGEGDIRG